MDKPQLGEIINSDHMTDDEHYRLSEFMQRRAQETPVRHWGQLLPDHPMIASNLLIHDGRPILADSRVSVSTIIGYLTLGPGMEALRAGYPDLSPEAIQQAVDFTLGLLQG